MSLLALEDVCKRYSNGGSRERVALHDVSFELEPGELVSVWGRRRSGRSTLLRLAAGIEAPDSGSVRFEGRAVSGRGTRALDQLCYCRKTFRPSEGQLVLDQLVIGQLSRGVSPSQACSRASEALKRAGVERCRSLRPAELDGAEAVRVAIARTLVRQPKLIVIDEPAIGIDLLARDGVLRLLRSLADDGIAVLASTGDATGLSSADRALALSEGELDGTLVPQRASVIPLRRASGG
jgi:ABC-type lipoprotein export system ATPase subunit